MRRRGPLASSSLRRRSDLPSTPLGRRGAAPTLWSMAYCSWMAPEVSEHELFAMASHAQARNAAIGVTGALFLSGGQVLQVLEGRRGTVTWLYEHILADPRHCRQVNILDQRIERRAFDGWSMRVLATHDLKGQELSAVLRALAWADRLGEVAPEVITPADFADCRAALAACAGRETRPRLHS